jgi:MerR family copper efflux transcriptional regulator
MKSLTLGDLASASGVNLETVRYYERRGLLPKPPRNASGRRLFPTEAAQRLRFIQRAWELGFSLKEIGELLWLRVSPTTTSAGIRGIRAKAEVKIADIKSKIRTLESMEKTLRKLTKSCTGCGPMAECPILESLMGTAYESVEARLARITECWRFAPSKAGLPFLRARVRSIAYLRWPWFSHIGCLSASSNRWVVPRRCIGSNGIQARERHGYGPFLLGLLAAAAVLLGKFRWKSAAGPAP